MAENSTNNDIFGNQSTDNMFDIKTPDLTQNMVDSSIAGTVNFTAAQTTGGANSAAFTYTQDLMTDPLTATTYDTSCWILSRDCKGYGF